MHDGIDALKNVIAIIILYLSQCLSGGLGIRDTQ